MTGYFFGPDQGTQAKQKRQRDSFKRGRFNWTLVPCNACLGGDLTVGLDVPQQDLGKSRGRAVFVSTPCATKAFLTASVCSRAPIPRLRRSMIGAGVPAGAKNDCAAPRNATNRDDCHIGQEHASLGFFITNPAPERENGTLQ